MSFANMFVTYFFVVVLVIFVSIQPHKVSDSTKKYVPVGVTCLSTEYIFIERM
ncbi:hypothetical protein Bca52824_085869 [Brassica carinata]|uniref:Uncharacterized protein n=1 Tax=Brassica carinata TaxID=52824 RepID=A0A8X7TM70_BRACI|nr:hypothetical protein Bca52824_085869 [Brassica carinata]